MEDVNTLKKQLRARMRALRDEMGAEKRAEIDAGIAKQVIAHDAYQSADMVFAYLSVGAEVDTRAIMRHAWEQGKRVAIPRCVLGTRLMDWYEVHDFDHLETSAFGVEEPIADPAMLVEVPGKGSDVRAIALVPAFTFDREGYRLGYGGGFYDTFLPAFGGVSAGLCRAAQFSDEPVVRDTHDCAVSLVFTEEGCIATHTM